MFLALAPALAAVLGVQALAVAAAWLLRRREQLLFRTLPWLVSVAVGVLLATAITHLLPESIERLGGTRAVYLLLGGSMLALFATERILASATGAAPEPLPSAHPHHHHHHHGGAPCAGPSAVHSGESARPTSLLLASMLHSTVDGATIAAGFLAGARTGWLTALAVALHEIPHRMGDFALLVQLGLPLPRALRFAMVAGLPALLGAAIVLLFGAARGHAVLWLLPISAGSFLYIALVNLLPELAVERRGSRVAAQLASVALGVVLVLLAGGLPQS